MFDLAGHVERFGAFEFFALIFQLSASMASFTAPNGSAVSIPGPAVVRIRDAYPEESTESNTKCRIDHPGVQFVTEEPSTVVPTVKSETLISASSPCRTTNPSGSMARSRGGRSVL
jgi:hypothetical protein